MNKKEFFDQMADVWDTRYYTPDLLRRLESLVTQFELQKCMKLLDVGTGTGGLLPLILKYVGGEGNIIATDFSEKMIQKARDKFNNQGNLTFSCAAVEDLPFKTVYFDSVICFGAFPHFEDKEKALSEMYRVLKEGGRLYIAHALGSKKLKEHHKGSSPVAHDVLPEKSEMKRMMSEMGFGKISILDKEKYYICQGEK